MTVEHEPRVYSYGRYWRWDCDCGDVSDRAWPLDELADAFADIEQHRMASAADPLDAA